MLAFWRGRVLSWMDFFWGGFDCGREEAGNTKALLIL
jgi:hypothetical protein